MSDRDISPTSLLGRYIARNFNLRYMFAILTQDKKIIMEFPGPTSVNLSSLPKIWRGHRTEYKIIPHDRLRASQDAFLRANGHQI